MTSRLQKFFKRKTVEEPQTTEKYQTVESTQLSHSSPDELMQIIYRYDTEVKRLNQLVEDSRAAAANLSKAKEEAQLYKEHMEALQKHSQGINDEMESMRTLLDSKTSEVTLLRGQLATKEQLLTQLINPTSENSGSAELQAAQQSVKLLEREVAQKAARAVTLQNEKANLIDRVAQFERDLQASELALRRERMETDAARGELNRVNFLRQSLETEIKAMRESLARTDEKLRVKEERLEKLQETVLERQAELAGLKQEGESKRLEYTRSASLIEESYRKDLEKLEGQLAKEREERRKEGEIMQEKTEKLAAAVKLAEDKAAQQATKGGYAEAELELLRQTCESAINRANTLEVEKQRLEDSFTKLQRKREMAKAEVLRLSHKIETRSSPGAQQWMKLNPSSVQSQDCSALASIRQELEGLYKQLMVLMLNARTSTGSKPDYLIGADEFSQFERRLNNLFVQVHDCIDLPEAEPEQVQPPPPQTWGMKISGAVSSIRHGPVKLFSCMSGDSNHRPKTVQGRGLRSNTGDAMRGKPGLSRHS